MDPANLEHLWNQPAPGLALRALAAIDDGPGGSIRRRVARAVLAQFDRRFGSLPDAARMTAADAARDAALEESSVLRLRLDLALSTAPTAETLAALRSAASAPRDIAVAAFATLPESVRAQAAARRSVQLVPALLCHVADYAVAEAGDVSALIAFAEAAEERPDEVRQFQSAADLLAAIRVALGPVNWSVAVRR